MSPAAALPTDLPDLLGRCVEGQRAAWNELHEIYRPLAFAFLCRLGVSTREADDACQEVFLQIFRYLHRFEGRADFRTWLYKLCISQAARRRRRAMLLGPLTWLRRCLTTPVAWSDGHAQDLVHQALGALSPRQREIFVLFELEGLATADIARLLGCPSASTRRLLQEARRRFEEVIRDQPMTRTAP